MKRNVILFLFLWACSLWSCENVWAQAGFFFDEFGGGYKAAAMGQAFTAVADDYSAAYYNPAGLTQIEGDFEGTIGYIYARPQLWAHFPGNSSIDLRDQPSSRGLFIGFASGLDLAKVVRVFPWFRRLSFGMAYYMNLPEVSQYHIGPVASRPYFLRHEKGFQLMALVFSLGVEITPWLSLGGGVIPSIDSYSDQDSFAALNYMYDEVIGERLSIHQTAKIVAVPVLGILLKWPHGALKGRLSLGISYRGENKAHNGNGTMDIVAGIESPEGEPLLGIRMPQFRLINLVGFAPEQTTVGIAARLMKGWTLAYDTTFKRYSAYRTYLGISPDPRFTNTWTHRFGVEYVWNPRSSVRVLQRVSKVCFRGGYYYEPTPIEDAQGTDNIYDSNQHVFSGGLCITLLGENTEHDFEFFYEYHRFNDRARQAFVDPVYWKEQGIRISEEFIPVQFGGNVWAFGASYTLRF